MNKDLKIGFIGCGKMASAIINGIISSGLTDKGNIIASEVSADVAQSASERLGIRVMADNKQLVKESDIVFLVTKPNIVTEILQEIKTHLSDDKLLVSIPAGVTFAKIENIIGKRRVVRVMPNTPALILEGMSGICKGEKATDEDLAVVDEILSNIGKTITVTEDKMDIVTAISGSGPAFFYKVIEDIARAGEKLGLDYEKSLQLALQTAKGAAKMIENRNGTAVQTLIDNVATKGGCTFVGISVMNDENSDRLFYDVIEKTTVKASQLG